MIKRRKFRRRANPSRTSPRESRRACLCDNGLYSRNCCKGNMINQGIGRITGEAGLSTSVWYGYIVQDCVTLHNHHIHVHDNPLEVGKTYYFVMENNDNGCHKVLSSTHSEGRHAEATSIAYDDCAECQAAN